MRIRTAKWYSKEAANPTAISLGTRFVIVQGTADQQPLSYAMFFILCTLNLKTVFCKLLS